MHVSTYAHVLWSRYVDHGTMLDATHMTRTTHDTHDASDATRPVQKMWLATSRYPVMAGQCIIPARPMSHQSYLTRAAHEEPGLATSREPGEASGKRDARVCGRPCVEVIR
jgi:hypothetical protein